MDTSSKTDCRERALFWALTADSIAANVKPGTSVAASETILANAGAKAAIAQVWATLALSATSA